MAKNDQKLSFQAKVRKMEYLFHYRICNTDLIAAAPSDNIVVNESKDGAKRLPIPKIEHLAIFDHFSPFEPAHTQPIDLTSTFID